MDKLWEDNLIAVYTANGWLIETNTDDRLCFAKYVDEDTEWMHDYFKKDGFCVKMNGRQKVNLICRNE